MENADNFGLMIKPSKKKRFKGKVIVKNEILIPLPKEFLDKCKWFKKNTES